MNPAMIMMLVQGIQAAIKAAPQIEAVAKEAKNFVVSLFSNGVITKEQQDSIHAHVDSVVAAVVSGVTPPEYQVEADPV